MAEISQKDQLALHEFSMRLRQAVAARSADKDQNLEPIKDAVREQYNMEQDARNAPSVEPPEPSKDREPEPPEPEM
jgi:hypothetical protein